MGPKNCDNERYSMCVMEIFTHVGYTNHRQFVKNWESFKLDK